MMETINSWHPLWSSLLKIGMLVVPLLLCVAYLTLAERKIIAAMQLRKGPNVVGVWGLLQPLADAARCRSEADWLVGINGTRAMTAFNSRDGGFFLTTVGRVQTPTLSVVVEREDPQQDPKLSEAPAGRGKSSSPSKPSPRQGRRSR